MASVTYALPLPGFVLTFAVYSSFFPVFHSASRPYLRLYRVQNEMGSPKLPAGNRETPGRKHKSLGD